MNSEKPRERILITAKRLFYHQGYSLTGINQIIKESKVSKDTLYRYFNGKEELLIEYIKVARNEWFEKFNQYLSFSKDNASKILSTFDFLKESMVSNEFKGCRFLNLLSDIETINEKARIEIVAHKHQLKEIFISLFMGLKNTNKSNKELKELAEVVYILFEGTIAECKVFKDLWPVAKSKKMVSKLIS